MGFLYISKINKKNPLKKLSENDRRMAGANRLERLRIFLENIMLPITLCSYENVAGLANLEIALMDRQSAVLPLNYSP